MINSPLLTKSKEFALEIICVCNDIKKEKRKVAATEKKEKTEQANNLLD